MNAKYLELPNFIRLDDLDRLKEIAPLHCKKEPASAKCEGKSADTYIINPSDHRDLEWIHEVYWFGWTKTTNELGYELYPMDMPKFAVYNIYEPGGFYPWHIDVSPPQEVFSDIKMTMVINASVKPYEDGDFHVAFDKVEDTHVKFMDEPGSAILFRSQSLHRVAPVTSGERRSLTLFFSGPRWR